MRTRCRLYATPGDNQLGLHLSRAPWDPYPWISGIQPDSSAQRAGLRLGDTILELNGSDVLGQKISEIAAHIRAHWQSGALYVTLGIWRRRAGDAEGNATPHGQQQQQSLDQQSLQRFATCLQHIAQLLECPVCLEVIRPPGWQCCNGHVMCNGCRHRSVKCPVCRVPLGPRGRCLLADKLFSLLTESFPCDSVRGGRRDEPKRGSLKLRAPHRISRDASAQPQKQLLQPVGPSEHSHQPDILPSSVGQAQTLPPANSDKSQQSCNSNTNSSSSSSSNGGNIGNALSSRVGPVETATKQQHETHERVDGRLARSKEHTRARAWGRVWSTVGGGGRSESQGRTRLGFLARLGLRAGKKLDGRADNAIAIVNNARTTNGLQRQRQLPVPEPETEPESGAVAVAVAARQRDEVHKNYHCAAGKSNCSSDGTGNGNGDGDVTVQTSCMASGNAGEINTNTGSNNRISSGSLMGEELLASTTNDSANFSAAIPAAMSARQMPTCPGGPSARHAARRARHRLASDAINPNDARKNARTEQLELVPRIALRQFWRGSAHFHGHLQCGRRMRVDTMMACLALARRQASATNESVSSSCWQPDRVLVAPASAPVTATATAVAVVENTAKYAIFLWHLPPIAPIDVSNFLAIVESKSSASRSTCGQMLADQSAQHAEEAELELDGKELSDVAVGGELMALTADREDHR